MTPELDKALCDKYPLIFADRGLDMMQSCMFWGLAVGDGWYNIIDIACGVIQGHIDWSHKAVRMAEEHNAIVRAVRVGDHSLFNKRFEKMDERWRTKYLEEMLASVVDGEKDYGMGIRSVPEVVPQLVAEQVKEKFAILRLYHRGGDKYCDGVIAMAEEMSSRICEECGAPGTVGGRGWIKTLCETHRKKIDEEQYSHQPEQNE